MKNNILLIITSLLLIGFTSCSDFLDRYPLEELSDGSYWKLPIDAEMFVADIYHALPGDGGSGDIDGDRNTDNAVHGIKWAQGDISKGIYDPANSTFDWKDDYKNIRKCNILLEKIDLIENYPVEDKEKTIGEARFFRAFIYFRLIRTYGDVPYVDSSLDMSELEGITRTPKMEVYAKVMEDFDYAISKLPLSWPADKYGRITKGAAQAMKAQAALYFAEWQTAADAAKAVIESNQYELFDAEGTGKYQELFWLDNEMSSEAILVRQYKANVKDNESYLMMWNAFPTVGWGGLNPTQSLVDAFECIDGAPISKSPLYNEKDPFKNRDPRCEACILHDGEELYGQTIKVAPLKSSGNTGIGQHGDATATGYYAQKFLDPNVLPSWHEERDWFVIRFAEVLLTYAEAKNEISPLDDSAFEAVNRVRKRAGIPALQKTDASALTYCGTQDELRQRIRNEWRVEYAFESDKRQWDVRRWGIAMQVLNAPILGLKYTLVDSPNAAPEDGGKICILYEGEPARANGPSYQEHNVIFPIYQNEIDLNPALTQNLGYN